LRSSVRAAAERAKEARKQADRLAVDAWNKRMLGFKGPAQPSPTLGDALNAGYRYLEVRCLGCDTHQTVALDIVRWPKSTPVHELERYMLCKDCSEVRGYPYKRSHLGGAAHHQDHGKRSALDMVARGTIVRMDWQSLETFSFGDHPVLADELVGLMLGGKKRATCWAVSEAWKEPL
jgi:hypothetical protein